METSTNVRDALADFTTAHMADRCRALYPAQDDLHRIRNAERLVLDGHCRRQADGTWSVLSQNGTTTRYTTTRKACECKDRYHRCKHRFAVAIAEEVEKATANVRYATLAQEHGLVWLGKDNAVFFMSLEHEDAFELTTVDELAYLHIGVRVDE